MTNHRFTTEEDFIIESAKKGVDVIKKGGLRLSWIHQRGKYLCQWFVRGRLVQAAALTAEAFLVSFKAAFHWILPVSAAEVFQRVAEASGV